MRKWVAVFLLAAMATISRAQQADQLYTASKDQLDVVKVILAQQAAWNKSDMAGYLGFYKDAEDTVAMLGAPVRGMTNIKSAFSINFPNAPSMGKLEDSGVEVRMMGASFALVTGDYDLSRAHKKGGDVHGTFTDVLEKLPIGWKVIYSQSAES
jgi:uncharacterized protein (TIGR02246 family)